MMIEGIGIELYIHKKKGKVGIPFNINFPL